MDSLGIVRASFGNPGQGPGELVSVGSLFITGERVYTYDLSNRRFTTFDLTGKLLATDTEDGMLFPFAIHGDSADYLATNGSVFWVVRKSLAGRGRTVINRRDSIPPARASFEHGFVLGNGASYRLFRYNADGGLVDSFGRTNLPTTRMAPTQVEARMASLSRYRGPDGNLMDPVWLADKREELENQTLPFFPQNRSLGFDGSGRLWVVGTTGDSMFTDVFADTTFLGRLTVECRDFSQGWSLAGRWLALVCGATATSDREAVIRMYEVVDY